MKRVYLQGEMMSIYEEIESLGDEMPTLKRGRKTVPILEINGVMCKKCSKCNKVHPLKLFSVIKRTRKFRSACNKCRVKECAEYRRKKRKDGSYIPRNRPCSDIRWLNDRLEQEIEKNNQKIQKINL